MAAIQSRFEVAVPELPDHIDPASYSGCPSTFPPNMTADVHPSDLLITVFLFSAVFYLVYSGVPLWILIESDGKSPAMLR